MLRGLLAVLSVIFALGALPFGAAHAQTQTLATAPWSGGPGWDGIMFDIDVSSATTLTAINVSPQTDNGTFTVYLRQGTHVGHESSSVGWSVIGTGTATAFGSGVLQIPLSQAVLAGETYGLYIQASGPGTPHVGYDVGAGVGAVNVSDATVTIRDGSGVTGLFGGADFPDRRFKGSITYGNPAPVPTLSEWAMILLGLTLAGVAATLLHRRRMAA